ncbi:MAG: lamin tail domain-containing protein [Gammaproteobacteria bacterium]|nr:lamin tail domain-containing protein [Gammaproteobacteria bacterium]
MPWKAPYCLLLCILLSMGCARPPAESGVACTLNPGDLALSEMMVSVTPGAPEWVEFFNPTSQAHILHRAVISFTSDTGMEQRWVIDDTQTIPAYGYWVVGNGAAPYVNSVAPHASGLSPRNMTVRLQCRDQVVDQVAVAAQQLAHTDRSAAFEGLMLPATELNDDARDWCVSSPAGNGTPGQANAPCGMNVCRDPEGRVRSSRAPQLHAVLLSEFYRDAPGPDDDREWIEFFNRSGEEFDLNGLVLVNDTSDASVRYDLRDEHCLSVAPAHYRVLRIMQDTTKAPPFDRVDATPIEGDALINGASAFTLLYQQQVLTQAALEGATAGISDGAENLIVDHPDYCRAHRASGFGVTDDSTKEFTERGSPGQANDPCGDVCLTEQGVWRTLQKPGADELMISEWFNNPRGADAGYEWIELYNSSDRSLDVNGIEIKNTQATSVNTTAVHIVQDTCATLEPRQRLVIGGNKAEFRNSINLIRSANFQLFNAPGELIVSRNGLEIDRATVVAPLEGISTSVDAQFLTPADNNDSTKLCAGRSVDLFSDAQGAAYGTPGQPNDPCGAQWCTEGGVWREQAPFAPGMLALNEVYYHAGGTDDGADWLEVKALADGDLYGLSIQQITSSGTRTWALTSAQCKHLTTGQYHVIAGEKAGIDAAGIIKGRDFYVAESEFVLESAGVAVDRARLPKLAANSARIPLVNLQDTIQNDAATQWCVGAGTTPGTENLACAP